MSKRILLISHNSLSLHANNGKTLTSLLSNWEPDEIAQLFFQQEIPESTKFYNFYRLTDLDMIKRAFSFSSSAGLIISARPKVESHRSIRNPLMRYLLDWARRLGPIKILMRDFIYRNAIVKNKRLLAWVQNFKPESILYVSGDYTFSFDIAILLAQLFKIPLNIYTTDDYIVNCNPVGVVARFNHAKLLKCYHSGSKLCRSWFVIGDDMASVFSELFNKKMHVAMNAVDIPSKLPVSNPDYTSNIEIIYAGGLHLGRLFVIKKISSVLSELNKNSSHNFFVTIYTPTLATRDDLRDIDHRVVRIRERITSDELKARISNAHFLLHVESFDPEFLSLTKLSVSTKIPEYLSSGVPIIAIGPSTQSSIRLLSANRLALLFDEYCEDDFIAQEIQRMVNSLQCRSDLISRAYNFSKSNYDINILAAKFNKILNGG